VKTTRVRAAAREVPGVLVDDVDVLAFALEAGCTSVLVQALREGQVGRDFVALRATPAGARAVHSVTEQIGLSAFAKGAGEGRVDVVIPIVPAPCDAARALAALVARLATDDADTPVEVCETIAAPWSVVVVGGVPRASAPLGWDELDRSAPPLEAVTAPDAFAPTRGCDLGAAVARLEKLVARR
jgi:hypothetical protein